MAGTDLESPETATGRIGSHSGRAAPLAPRRHHLFGPLWHRARQILSSYRLRLLAWFVGLLGLGTLATVLVVGEVLLRGTDERIRRDLVQETQEFATLVGGTDPLTGQPFGTDVARIFDVFLDRNVTARNEVVLTFLDGRFYARSRSAPHVELQHEPEFVAQVANLTQPGNGRYASSSGAVEYLAVPIAVDGAWRGVFVVAAFRDIERAEQDNILRAVATVGLVLLVIGSILAWRLADRVLAPVRRTAATARSINETDLSQRVHVEGHDEVAELALTFNEMLDRVSGVLEGQRRFMDDAGHELRTPLTIARGHLELVDPANPEDLRRTLDLVLDELERMTRIVNDLVLLAAASRPDFLRSTTFRADDLVTTAYEKTRVLGDRDWRLEARTDLDLSGDRQRLTQALIQLVDNAVEHTQVGDLIELGADSDGTMVRLWVRDSGRGIPLEEQQQIFTRFYRGDVDRRRQGGHVGLGLSIVHAIAEAHGGSVNIESAPGHGSKFTLAIPRAHHRARRHLGQEGDAGEEPS